MIPTPFNYFFFLVLRLGFAEAQHLKKSSGAAKPPPNPHFVKVFSRI